MMNATQINKVYESTDYGAFRLLIGNRNVDENRVKKVIRSINRYGQIKLPVIINEKHEVIEGQATLEACKRLNIPVPYMIIKGIGIDECIALNTSSTNWKLENYIKSYADRGVPAYQYFLALRKEFLGFFPEKVIRCAVTGKAEGYNGVIKDGNLVCDEHIYNRARSDMTWLKNYKTIFDRIQGHTEYYYIVLLFCHCCVRLNEKRLYKQLYERQGDLIPVTNIKQAIEHIEAVYNFSLQKASRIKLMEEYVRLSGKKTGWMN